MLACLLVHAHAAIALAIADILLLPLLLVIAGARAHVCSLICLLDLTFAVDDIAILLLLLQMLSIAFSLACDLATVAPAIALA